MSRRLADFAVTSRGSGCSAIRPCDLLAVEDYFEVKIISLTILENPVWPIRYDANYGLGISKPDFQRIRPTPTICQRVSLQGRRHYRSPTELLGLQRRP